MSRGHRESHVNSDVKVGLQMEESTYGCMMQNCGRKVGNWG